MKTLAVILAAGRGSRLKARTTDRPKCLVELAGRPLLDWSIDSLHAAGINEIKVVGGYCREQLKGPFEVRANPRWEQTNMVRSLLAVEDLLEKAQVLVAYSDIVFHPDHVRALLAAESPAITYDRRWKELWSERFDDPLKDAETFKLEGDRVVEIGRKPERLEQIQGQYMGLLSFTPDAWAKVSALLRQCTDAELDRLDMTSLLSRFLASGHRLHAVGVDGRWCEADSETDLALYERKLATGTPWAHDWRWKG